MTLTAVGLLLVAAFAHAWWNLMGKKQSPSGTFFLIACLAGMACLTPVLLVRGGMVAQIPWRIWMLLGATAVFQAIYYLGLARAYRLGHISLAYPLARAVPVVLVALVNVMIGRAREIGPLAMAGMAVIGVGCLLLPMRTFREFRVKHYLHASSVMAVVAALGTVGYTIVDSEALKMLRAPLENPSPWLKAEVAILYLMFEMAFSAIVLAVYVLVMKSERREWATLNRAGVKGAAAAGAMIVAAYGLALMAMGEVSNVSYVAAFRQVSIPVGVGMGVVLLKEPCPTPKVAGVSLLLAGLMMVGFG